MYSLCIISINPSFIGHGIGAWTEKSLNFSSETLQKLKFILTWNAFLNAVGV